MKFNTNIPKNVRNVELMVCWWLTNEDDSLTRLDKIDLLFTHNLFYRDTSNSPIFNTLTIPSLGFHTDRKKQTNISGLAYDTTMIFDEDLPFINLFLKSFII